MKDERDFFRSRAELLKLIANDTEPGLLKKLAQKPYLEWDDLAGLLFKETPKKKAVKSALKKPAVQAAVMRIDGASRGNPGPASAAVIIELPGGEVVRFGKPLGFKTNNFAEYQALLLGLEKAIELGVLNLQVFSDSELLVRQLNGVYSVKSPDIIPLKSRADQLVSRFEKVLITHVRREQNKDADKLANDVLDGRFIP